MTENKESDFSSWHLHDGVLNSITLEWESRQCITTISVFLEPGKAAVSCMLRWENVTVVHIPHDEPWGTSVFINKQWIDNLGVYIIQMQSGDEIRITAERVSLIPTQAQFDNSRQGL